MKQAFDTPAPARRAPPPAEPTPVIARSARSATKQSRPKRRTQLCVSSHDPETRKHKTDDTRETPSPARRRTAKTRPAPAREPPQARPHRRALLRPPRTRPKPPLPGRKWRRAPDGSPRGETRRRARRDLSSTGTAPNAPERRDRRTTQREPSVPTPSPAMAEAAPPAAHLALSGTLPRPAAPRRSAAVPAIRQPPDSRRAPSARQSQTRKAR